MADSKTPRGIRKIPITHDIQQRIERSKQTSMAANDEYLFSELTGSNKYENRSMAIGKRFGRLKEKLGFGRNYGFHSFRSTLANLFDAAGVRENFAARIIGHKTRNNDLRALFRRHTVATKSRYNGKDKLLAFRLAHKKNLR